MVELSRLAGAGRSWSADLRRLRRVPGHLPRGQGMRDSPRALAAVDLGVRPLL